MYYSAKQLNRNLPRKKHQELKHDSLEESQRDQTARKKELHESVSDVLRYS